MATRVGNRDTTPRFFETKSEECPKGVARRGANPVWVAAAGVKELGHLIAFGNLGKLDQFIFQLERAEFEQRLLPGA